MPRTKAPKGRSTKRTLAALAGEIRVPKNQIDPTKESKKMGRTADFSGVGDFPIINVNGSYELEFESYEWKDPKEKKPSNTNPATGNVYQYANLKWIVRDEVDSNGDSIEGKVVFDTISESPNSLFMLKRVAIAAGADPEQFEPEVDENGKKLPLKLDIDAIYGEMVGRRVLATVVVDEYKNDDDTVRKSNKITKYESIESGVEALSARR